MSDQNTKTVKLSNAEVDVKTQLTWGEVQQVESSLIGSARMNSGSGEVAFDNSAMLESKYKLLEVAVTEVRENGESKKFTREWMDNLSVEDGDTLYAEIEHLTKKNG